VVFDSIRFDRTKGPGTDIERQCRNSDSTRAQFADERPVEVQPGGRCRHRIGVSGKHGLIVAPVAFQIGAVDVWRQGNMTVLVEPVMKPAVAVK
jgi:hypothetical protein